MTTMPHYVYEPSVRDEVLISRFVDISRFMLYTDERLAFSNSILSASFLLGLVQHLFFRLKKLSIFTTFKHLCWYRIKYQKGLQQGLKTLVAF